MSFVAHFSNSTTANSSSNTVNVSGLQAGDIALLCMYCGNSSSTLTFPSGFAAIGSLTNMNIATADGTCTAGIQWKACTGSESSFTVSFTGGTNLSTLVCRVYRGRNTSNPFTASTKTGPIAAVGMGFNTSITGLTAANSDDVVLFVPFQQTPSSAETLTFTAPSGYGNSSTDYASGNANTPCVGSCDKIAVSAGATGTLSANLNDNEGLSTGYGAYLVSMTVPYVLVQSKSASSFNTSVSSLSATFSSAVTPGNTLIAYVGCIDSTNVTGTYTVSDNVNTGNYASDITNAGGGNFSIGIFRFSATAAGTPTVTVQRATGTSTSHLGLVIEEWSGIAPTFPLDQSISNNNTVINSSPTSANTGNYTENGELMLSCGVTPNGVTWTAGSGFTMSPQTSGGLGGFFAAENQSLGGTTATAATYTINSSQFWQVVAAVYKPAQPNLGSLTASVQVGTPGATVKYALTAQTITSAEGTPTYNVAPTLGSTSGIFVEGSLLNQLSLGSQTATFTEGTITTTISGNVTLALSGLAGSFVGGLLADNVGYVLDNTIQGINIIGQTATFAQGSMTYAVVPPLTAQTITSTFQPPTFTPTYSLSAETITSLEGFITSNLGNNVTQILGKQTATFSQQPMSFVPSYGLTAFTPTFTEGTLTFSATGDFNVSLSGQLATFTEGVIIQAFMGGMPNVVGIPIEEAELVLVQAGVLNPQILGYFGTYPLTFQWAQSVQPPGTVLAQSLPPGTVFTVNQPITLTISEFPLGVVSP